MFFERFDRTVYECDLLSITPNIKVNSDWENWKNIENAKTKVAARIMVQPTIRKNIYREIVTGMPIPVYRITKRNNEFMPDDEEECHFVPYQPVFIKIRGYSNRSCPKLVANFKDIKKYIEKNTAPNVDYKAQLEDIFQKAEEYYKNAYMLDRQEKSDRHSQKQEIESMLRTLRKK